MTNYLGRLLQRAAGETPTEPLRPLIQNWPSPAISDAFETVIAEPELDPGSAPQPAPPAEPPARSRATMPRHPASSPAAEPGTPPVEELPTARGPSQRRDGPSAIPSVTQPAGRTSPSDSTRSPWARSPADAGRGQIVPHQDMGAEIVRPRRPGGRDGIPMAEDTAAEPRPAAGRKDAEPTASAPRPPAFEAPRTEDAPSLESPRVVERPRSEAVEAPTVRPRTQALGQKEATYREPAPLLQPPSPPPLQPQPVPSEQPRLVIGNLRVEVVPPTAETSRPQPVRTVQRVEPAQRPGPLRRSSKLRFGLGQM